MAAMVSSELWTREAAERYDGEDGGSGASAVGPAVDFLAGLASGGRALEFAIGTGRIGLPLSRRGVPVAGIELSPPMVDVLRRKPGGGADAIPVVIGDMATASVPGRFRLVYLVYNTIGNLLTQDEQVACFSNAARHLEPGGRFVIEVGVPPLRRLVPGAEAVPFDISPGHVGFDTFEPAAQLLTSHHFTAGAGGRFRRSESRHRFVWPAELDLMARIAGLTPESRTADWSGGPFTSESEQHISVWRKPS